MRLSLILCVLFLSAGAASCNDEPDVKVISLDSDTESTTDTSTEIKNPKPTDSEVVHDTTLDTFWPLDTESATDTGVDTGVENNEVLATDVRIDSIDIYQAVRIPLLSAGDAVPQSLPLVEGKDALLRVYAVPEETFVSRPLLAQVEVLDTAGNSMFFAGQSTELNIPDINLLSTTLNVSLPGTALTRGASVSVSIVEPDQVSGSGEISFPKWPAIGTVDLTTVDPAGPFRVLIVPVRYNADQSGRLPDLSLDAQKRLRQKFEVMYPASTIQMEIMESPFEWNTPVTADGDGFDQLLEAVQLLRMERNAPGNQYYLGLFKPTELFIDDFDSSAFCNLGCTTGLSNLVEAVSDDWARASIALDYLDDPDPDWMEYHLETILHEIGHANGREHAPSGGADSPDPAYPYSDGKIGVQGYDLIKKRLYSPTDHFDLMGYDSPQWISDYTYNGLLQRIRDVNKFYAGARILSPAPPAEKESVIWLSVRFAYDGSTRLGLPLPLRRPPVGHSKTTVVLFDRDNTEIATLDAVFAAFGHNAGGQVLFVQPPSAVLSRVDYIQLPEFNRTVRVN